MKLTENENIEIIKASGEKVKFSSKGMINLEQHVTDKKQ